MTTIPKMINPLGIHWKQPSRENIEIDDTHALICYEDFKELNVYNTSLPSGVYDGKMWKCFSGGRWWLRWYAPSENPNKCSILNREILPLDWEIRNDES